MLVSRADRDPEPARDRVTIVIADKDPLLAQRVHDSSGNVAWGRLDEDEVGFRWRVFESKLVQLELQPATLGDDVVDDPAVVLFVLDGRRGRDDGEDLDMVRRIKRLSCLGSSPTCDSKAKSTYASSSTTTPCDRFKARSTDGPACQVPVGEFGLTRNFSGAGSSMSSLDQVNISPLGLGDGTAS